MAAAMMIRIPPTITMLSRMTCFSCDREISLYIRTSTIRAQKAVTAAASLTAKTPP